jgi:hypothetical protein
VEKTTLNHRGPDNTVDGAFTVDLAPEGAGTLLRYHSTAKLAGSIALAHPRSSGRWRRRPSANSSPALSSRCASRARPMDLALPAS